MRRDLQHLHDFNASQEVLREAIAAGLVNTNIGQQDYPLLITAGVLEFAEAAFSDSAATNTADWENAGKSPKSIRFRESSRGRVVHPGESPPFAAWNVELARFAVPRGKIGVVKGFEQYLAQSAVLENPAYIYTQNSRWGIPGPWHTGIANPISNPGVWHFRLHNIRRAVPPWWTLVGAGSLPDLPYTDFAHEEELWWPAGSAASQNIHLIVPAGYLLRLIYTTPEQSVRLEVAAKLKGYVQSDRTPETAHNVRTNY